jgi:hypothetical protein
MVGLFAILQGPSNAVCAQMGIQKRNELLVGFSRDGFHWDRPWRERFIPVDDTPGAWNAGNVQSVGGGCLVVGDSLYFYFSGRPNGCRTHWDTCAQTGLAVLRRDGFASLDAGAEPAALTTRPVTFPGRHLFVNVAAAAGELKAEILDQAGAVINPFSSENCAPIRGDKTLAAVHWEGADLSAVAGKPVRIRFHLRRGSLYAFWISEQATGASGGFVAAGGPDFDQPRDTVGAGRPAAGQR